MADWGGEGEERGGGGGELVRALEYENECAPANIYS